MHDNEFSQMSLKCTVTLGLKCYFSKVTLCCGECGVFTIGKICYFLLHKLLFFFLCA